MKKFWKDFFLRGLLCAAGGPAVLAVIYGILGATGEATALTPGEVCLGILTITLLAFLAAGMTAIYQVEQLPLPMQILLHGGVLYVAYILIYLLNGWLASRLEAVLVFTAVFAACYGLIWLGIYLFNRAKAKKLNSLLNK